MAAAAASTNATASLHFIVLFLSLSLSCHTPQKGKKKKTRQSAQHEKEDRSLNKVIDPGTMMKDNFFFFFLLLLCASSSSSSFRGFQNIPIHEKTKSVDVSKLLIFLFRWGLVPPFLFYISILFFFFFFFPIAISRMNESATKKRNEDEGLVGAQELRVENLWMLELNYRPPRQVGTRYQAVGEPYGKGGAISWGLASPFVRAIFSCRKSIRFLRSHCALAIRSRARVNASSIHWFLIGSECDGGPFGGSALVADPSARHSLAEPGKRDGHFARNGRCPLPELNNDQRRWWRQQRGRPNWSSAQVARRCCYAGPLDAAADVGIRTLWVWHCIAIEKEWCKIKFFFMLCPPFSLFLYLFSLDHQLDSIMQTLSDVSLMFYPLYGDLAFLPLFLCLLDLKQAVSVSIIVLGRSSSSLSFSFLFSITVIYYCFNCFPPSRVMVGKDWSLRDAGTHGKIFIDDPVASSICPCC